VNLGLAIIRVVTGLALCVVFEKVLPRDGVWGPQPWFVEDVAEMGFPAPSFFAWCAALSEFVGGILLVLGLMTRPAAFFNAITTFVAAFLFHKGDVSGSGLLATLFFALSSAICFTGPGSLSVDALLTRFLRNRAHGEIGKT
jgi:putative oxidoreductase